jgi:hypothetical protein
MDWCVGCYAAIGVHYFWSIHPKISNKDIQLIIKEKEENNMTFPREVVEAVDIYSAFEGECHLQLNKMDRNKVYVINSKESLSEFVSCDEICQTVNLNKKTLLLAHGSTNFDVHLKSYKLTQLSKGDFQLDADIEEGMATVPTGNWQVALLIPKIAQDATVNLTVNVTRLSDLNKSLQ